APSPDPDARAGLVARGVGVALSMVDAQGAGPHRRGSSDADRRDVALSEARPQGRPPLSADNRPSFATGAVMAALVAANVLLFVLIAEDLLEGAGLVSHDDAVLEWFVDHRKDWMIRAAKVIGAVTSFTPLLIVGVLLGLWLWRRGCALALAAAPAVSLSLAGLCSTI